MPKTKSAERRMRSSRRRQIYNRRSKSRLKTLEKAFVAKVASGTQEEARAAYRAVASALDKAANRGVIHGGNASRKKSRLAQHFVKAGSQPAPAPAPAPTA